MNRDLDSFPRLTCGFDAPAVIFHDALADGKPQAQARALFRRKKRFKNLGQIMRLDAARRIFDFYDACRWAVNGRIDFSVDPQVAAVRQRKKTETVIHEQHELFRTTISSIAATQNNWKNVLVNLYLNTIAGRSQS